MSEPLGGTDRPEMWATGRTKEEGGEESQGESRRKGRKERGRDDREKRRARPQAAAASCGL